MKRWEDMDKQLWVRVGFGLVAYEGKRSVDDSTVVRAIKR